MFNFFVWIPSPFSHPVTLIFHASACLLSSHVSTPIHHDYDYLPDIVLVPVSVPKQPSANEMDSWRPLKLTLRWQQQQLLEVLHVARWGLHGLDSSIHRIQVSIEFGGRVNTSSSLRCSNVPEPFLLGSKVHYPAAIGHSHQWILFTSKGWTCTVYSDTFLAEPASTPLATLAHLKASFHFPCTSLSLCCPPLFLPWAIFHEHWPQCTGEHPTRVADSEMPRSSQGTLTVWPLSNLLVTHQHVYLLPCKF